MSELILKGRVIGKGDISARLFKHHSPSTMAKIQRAVPMIGRINQYEKNFAYILTDIVAGEEKSRQEFKRGEVAFMPSGSMICIFLEDTKSYKPMNFLGALTSGMEHLEKSRRGDALEIQSIESV
ncbi:MAG: cyclophilin-like family protein [Nitrososphaerales archaeon]